MGRELSERELKRLGRVLAGHSRDKDRARRQRKAQGQAVRKERRREDGTAPEDLDEGKDAKDEEA
jgi:hypothetical protein